MARDVIKLYGVDAGGLPDFSPVEEVLQDARGRPVPGQTNCTTVLTVTCTQAAYDALAVKDSATIYMIVG